MACSGWLPGNSDLYLLSIDIPATPFTIKPDSPISEKEVLTYSSLKLISMIINKYAKIANICANWINVARIFMVSSQGNATASY